MSSITVYSTALCAPCEQMKAWLTHHNYPYTVRDVMMDEEAGEVLESRNIRSTPVLQVGDQFVVGLDLMAMEQVLDGWSA
ncbi:MAG: glutaredoxin [Candidatus Poriferisodalaceae bacterium]|jgi:glutaredoxin